MKLTKNTQIKVLSFGPALNVKGGISNVEKLILSHLPDSIIVKHIATTIDSNKIIKTFYFFYAIIRTIINLPFYNIFHIHFASRGSTFRKIIICYIGLIFRKKLIMHAHGGRFHLFYNNISNIFKGVIKSVFLKVDILIAVSEKWKQYYKDTFNLEDSKIIVLPNPVSLHINKLLIKDDYPIKLIYLGRIGKNKGAYDLINAIQNLIKQKKLNIKLIMAGDGEVDSVRNLVKSLNISEYIEVKDWIYENERNRLFEFSDIFVLPSYNEGLPLALLEAMSFGLAIITTPVGGIPEVIKNGENGILVEPGDVNGLTNAIELLCNNSELRHRLQSEAFETAQKYDIKCYVEKLVSYYDILIKE